MATPTSFDAFPIQDFFDLVLPELPGANPDIVRQELDRTLREYFIRSGAWRLRLGPYALGIMATQIDINQQLAIFATAYRVAHVFTVWREDREVPVLQYPLSLRLDQRFAERPWTSPYRGVVEFAGEPSATITLGYEFQCSVYPLERSQALDRWVWEDHSEGIRSGVLGRMLAQVGKPYTNPQVASVHLRRYTSAIAQAKAIADRGGVPDAATWSYPRTFA